MANNVTRGQTFTTQATAQMLNDLVDLATVHSINRDGFDSVSRPVTATGSDLPSPVAGEIQFRTDQIGAQIFDGSNFHDIPTVRRLANKSGDARSKGDVVVSDSTTDNAFTTSTSATYRGEIGVLLEAAATDTIRTVRFSGHVQTVNVDGPVTRGQYLKLSTGTAGKATGTSTFSGEVFGRVLVGGATTCSALLFGGAMGGSELGVGPFVRVFTGSGTYTKPAGLVRAIVTVLGGGGGGGGALTTGTGEGSMGAGGAGGGASTRYLAASSIGATEAVTVGAGGAGGVGDADGAGGGSSSFGSLVVATGGGGGGRVSNGPLAAVVTGGNGGSASGTTDIGYTGEGGGIGFRTAGGVLVVGGAGGCSAYGGGARSSGSGENGLAGGNFGGGGSGASNPENSPSKTGGAGANGLVIVEEFF